MDPSSRSRALWPVPSTLRRLHLPAGGASYYDPGKGKRGIRRREECEKERAIVRGVRPAAGGGSERSFRWRGSRLEIEPREHSSEWDSYSAVRTMTKLTT